eukprot:CCRYP_001841-RA/>CCRYP_001841-RA protein AED:0.52 eAED:0.52 QI:0/0/0/0.5/0/0/2/0/98
MIHPTPRHPQITSSEGASAVTSSNNGSSALHPDSTSVSEGDDELKMPTMVNLHESGLRRSPGISAMKALTSIMAVFLTPVTAIPASYDFASLGIRHLN